jgi:hypothetical protein
MTIISQIVDRFLGWKLPEDFNPDGGISFKREYNKGTPYPAIHEPTGTNLFTATQAKAMFEYVLNDLLVELQLNAHGMGQESALSDYLTEDERLVNERALRAEAHIMELKLLLTSAMEQRKWLQTDAETFWKRIAELEADKAKLEAKCASFQETLEIIAGRK